MKKPALLALGPVAPAVVIAGCGGGSSSPSYGAAPSARSGARITLRDSDSEPGDTTGQALNQFGAKWYVVSRNGSQIDTDGH